MSAIGNTYIVEVANTFVIPILGVEIAQRSESGISGRLRLPNPTFNFDFPTKVDVRKHVLNVFGEASFIRSGRFVVMLSRLTSFDFVFQLLY